MAMGPHSKDGLIRMLLQSAQPTMQPPMSGGTPQLPTTPAMPPPGVTPPGSGPNTPLKGSPGSAGQPLSAPPRLPSTPVNPASMSLPLTHPYLMSPPASEVKEDERARNYIYQIEGKERELGLIMLDHSYSKPFNWRPEIGFGAKPTRYLFGSNEPRAQGATSPTQLKCDAFIDVVETDSVKRRPVNSAKATSRMEECERFVSFPNPDAKPLKESEEWEEGILKEFWTRPQHRLFNRTMKVLHADRLARLANRDVDDEPLLRRITVDKSAKRLRSVLAGALWDTKMIQWLHLSLVDHLPTEYLAAYLDVLQTLRGKIPSLVEKMIAGKVYHEMYETVPDEGLRILLNSKWDPASSGLSENKLKRLPGNPTIILTPSGPEDEWAAMASSSRGRLWQKMLSQLGQFVRLKPPELKKEEPDMRIGAFLHQMVTDTIAKVREVKKADKSVILVGWGVAAAVNCQVAAMEPVSACICLGFPMFTLEGARGDADDPILDLRSHVLFVVGEVATQCRTDDVEDMRERMRAGSGLVVVGGADDHLRVNKHKKHLERVTQSMVDRCIVDEIRDFCVGVLTAPPPPTFAMPSFMQKGGTAVDHLLAAASGGGPITPGTTPTRKTAPRRRKTQTAGDGSEPPKRRRTNKSPSARSKLAALGPSNPAGASSQSQGIPSAPSSATASPGTPSTASVSLPTTPLKPLDPHHNPPKARKILDMSSTAAAPTIVNLQPPPSAGLQPSSQQPQPHHADSRTAQMMRSSPLLSSALTSPTKVTTTTTTMTRVSLPGPISTQAISLPQQPSPIPIVPSVIARHPLPVPLPQVPTMAAILQQPPASLQQRPPPPPIVAPSGNIRPAAIGPTQARLKTSPPKTVTVTAGGAKVVTSAGGGPVIMLPSSVTAAAGPANKTLVTATKSLPPKATSPAPQQPRIATLPAGVNIAHVVKKANQQLSVPVTVSGSVGGAKENLYVIALPPDQLRNLESSGLGSQMVTLVSGEKAAAAIKSKVAEAGAGGGGGLIVTKAGGTAGVAGSGSATPTPGTPNTVEKRNVAEILASLSGLVPDPVVTATKSDPKAQAAKTTSSTKTATAVTVAKTTATASAGMAAATPVTITTAATGAVTIKAAPSILQSSSGSGGMGRVVRVLQTGTSRPAIQATQLVVPAPPAAQSSSASSSGGGRSRKQVFVTSEKKEAKDDGGGGGEASKSKEGKDGSEERELTGSKKEEATTSEVSTASSSPSVVYEKDILEEDVDDSEYIPYQKKSKAKKVAEQATKGGTASSTSSSSSSEQPQPIKKALRSSRKSAS